MTYNVFGGTLNLTQPTTVQCLWATAMRKFTAVLYWAVNDP